MVLSVSTTCRGMGRNQRCGTCEASGPWRPWGFLLVWELIWEGLFDSAWARWAGLRFCRHPAFGAALPRRSKETPVLFTGD